MYKTVREAGRLMGIAGLEPVTRPMDEAVQWVRASHRTNQDQNML